MNDPRCPACRSELSLAHAMQMRNPWRYQCPECRVALDPGPAHKFATVALAPVGTVVLGGAFTLQQLEILNRPASLTFMGACAVALLATAVWIWRNTKFTRKRRATAAS